MGEVTNRNFGLLIAYIIPGFVVLIGLSPLSPTVQTWLSASAEVGEWPTIGGFLYVTLASVGLGMTASAIRWFLIDRIHEWTGLKRPDWDDSRLQANLAAFDLIVEHHYRYYQFYANTMVAVIVAYGVHLAETEMPIALNWIDLLVLSVFIIFWATSRDVLAKYYKRASALLIQQESIMANGSHPKSETKPAQEKPSDAQSSTSTSKPDAAKSGSSK